MSSTPTAIRPSPRIRASEFTRGATPALLLAITAALAFPSGTASAQSAPAKASACPAGWAPVPAGVNPALRCLPRSLIASLPRQRASASPPRGCPSGWQPVSSALNPVLRCLPDGLPADAPRAADPSGCPAGWTLVPPGVNPLLRCLPDNIAALASKSRAVAQSGCPTGWKPVEAGVNPVMRCLPGSVGIINPPQKGGPGTGDPGQGRDGPTQAVALDLDLDLALVEAFRVGPTLMEWGTGGEVPASSAAFRRSGTCGFRFLYRTGNQGAAGTKQSVNRIRRDTEAGPVLASSKLPALEVGAVDTSDGHIYLNPGTWMLYVHADAPNLVPEANEANNLRHVRVTVTGSCEG